MSQILEPSKPEGFLLLTLQNVELRASYIQPPVQTGPLALECITIAVSQTDYDTPYQPLSQAAGNQRDVWLLLRINQFEVPLSATDPIIHSRYNRSYTFTTSDGVFTVTLPQGYSRAEEEDIETFEVLLAQYGVLKEADPKKASDGSEDLKGRLVLVDEDNGEVVGTLGEEFSIQEDPNVRMSEKDPVVFEIPDDGGAIHVQSITPEGGDFIYTGATYISRGMIFATDMIGTGMSRASEYYIKNSTPREKPIVFSENTHATLRRIHGISGQAVTVTAKTTGLIHNLVDKAAARVSGAASRSPAASASGSQSPAPLLPPRYSDKGSYNEKGQPSSDPISRTSTTSNSKTLTPPPMPPRVPTSTGKRLLNRVLMSTDLLLTTVENSAQHLVTHASTSLSASLGHKYGPDVASAVMTAGGTVRNVGVVYIDVRGVGRRALIKRAGKKVIKGRMGKKEVVFGANENEGENEGDPITMDDGSGVMRTPMSGGDNRWSFKEKQA